MLMRMVRNIAAAVWLTWALSLSAAAVAADPPQLAVFVMNADGSELRKLIQAPDKKWHAAPTWSSDGKRVIFHAYPKDATTPDSHVFSVQDDGSNLQDLGAGAAACWTPDGKQIIFSIAEQNLEKAQVGLWVMNADGKGRQFLFPGTAPSFAPDGSRLLYVSAHEGNQSIYVYDVLEGMSKKILQEPYQTRPGWARWSPDAKRVAFVDERKGKFELIVIDAAGSDKGQSVKYTGLIGGPVAWGPDGKLVTWKREKEASEPQRLYVFNADNDDSPAPLGTLDGGTLNFDPCWSPDFKRIVFVSDRVLEK